MVRDMDHSLFPNDEIGTVFEEMMKTVPKDHLKTDVVRVLMAILYNDYYCIELL